MTQKGYGLEGLCYREDCLYVVEGRQVEPDKAPLRLTVYRVESDSGHTTRLDTLTGLSKVYKPSPLCPRVDRHSRWVFIPSEESGVTVAHLDGDRLVRERTLTCVNDAVSVDVVSPNTIYVGDRRSLCVHVVDVTEDRITSTLEKPDTARGEGPYNLAVLGDRIMVGYGYFTLIVYNDGSPTPVRVIPRPTGLERMTAISIEGHSNFIVTDYKTRSVFVINKNGELCHTVGIDTDKGLRDCAVVNRQLWVGCMNGDIVIMSSQQPPE